MKIDPKAESLTPTQQKLKKACKDFEAVMVNQLLSQMSKGSGLLESSSASQTYHEILNDELAKQISVGPGMGIADMLYQQMKEQVDESG